MTRVEHIHSGLHNIITDHTARTSLGLQHGDVLISLGTVCQQLAQVANIECALSSELLMSENKTRQEKSRGSLDTLQTENEQLQLQLEPILTANELCIGAGHVEGHDDEGHVEGRVERLVEDARELKDENDAFITDCQQKNTFQNATSDDSECSYDVNKTGKDCARGQNMMNNDLYIDRQNKFDLLCDKNPDQPLALIVYNFSMNLDERRSARASLIDEESQSADVFERPSMNGTSVIDEERRSSVSAGTSVSDEDVCSRDLERPRASSIYKSKTSCAERTLESRDHETRDYKELYEELLSKLVEMQACMNRNSAFQVEFKRISEENEEMVEMIIELRAEMDRKCAEVSTLTRKVTLLERQLISQIEDFSASLKRLMNKSDTVDSDVESHESGCPGSRVVWTIGSGSVVSDAECDLERAEPADNGQKLNDISVTLSDSRITIDNTANHTSVDVVSKSLSPQDARQERVDEKLRVKDIAAETGDGKIRVRNEQCVGSLKTSSFSVKLDSEFDVTALRSHVIDLREEIKALKKTVLEQGRYLVNVDEKRETRMTCLKFDLGGSMSNVINNRCITDETLQDECVQMQLQQQMAPMYGSDRSEIGLSPIITSRLCSDGPQCSAIFRTNLNIVIADSSQTEVMRNTAELINSSQQSVDKSETLQSIDINEQPVGDSFIHWSEYRDIGINKQPVGDPYRASEHNSELLSSSTRYGDISTIVTPSVNTAPTVQQDDTDTQTSRDCSQPMAHKGDYQSSFNEASVLYLNRVTFNLEPSAMKRAWSEGDLCSSRPLSRDYEQLHVADTQRQNYVNAYGNAKLDIHRVTAPQLIEEQIEYNRVALKNINGSDLSWQVKLAAEAEIVRKYTALVNSLRRTCELVNSYQMENINCEEDYLSVEELLLLIDSYEQIVVDKNSLEDENRVLMMELDQVTARQWRSRTDGNSTQLCVPLSAILEESLKEEIAELQYELEMMDREVEDANKALMESRHSETKITLVVEQLRKQVHELHKLFDARYLEDVLTDTERQKVDNCSQTELEGSEYYYQSLNLDAEIDASRRKKVDKDDNYTDITYERHVRTHSVINSPEKTLSFVLSASKTDPLNIDSVDHFKGRQEMMRFRQWISCSEGTDDMFCLQEKLATEIELLSTELNDRETQLEKCQENCRQLGDNCHVLQQVNHQLVKQLHTENESRRNYLGKYRTKENHAEIYAKLIEQLAHLQLVNSRLLEERARLLIDLKTEIANNGSTCTVVNDFLERANNDGYLVSPDLEPIAKPMQTGLSVEANCWGKIPRLSVLVNNVDESEAEDSAVGSNSTNIDVDTSVGCRELVDADTSLGCRELVCQMHAHNARLRDFISVLEQHLGDMAVRAATARIATTERHVTQQIERSFPISQTLNFYRSLQNITDL